METPNPDNAPASSSSNANPTGSPAGNSAPTPSAAHAGANQTSESWDRRVLEKLATESLREQKRARRWSIFFKFAFIVYASILVLPYIPWENLVPEEGEKHTALIELVGPIGPETPASADRIVTALRAAFDDKNTAGIVMRINSPGGSPVQSGYIHDEIKRLRKKHPDTKLYAVIADLCASGGYYVAAAADEIYADKGSIVGSIGVVMNGFGFVDAMDKLGVERRLITAGKHKGLLDPFSPENPAETTHIQTMLDEIHQQFIDVVKKGRGERLKGSDEELFNGFVWTGERSVELGLVDALGTSSGVARDIIGAEQMINYTVQDTWMQRFADRLGLSLAKGIWAQTKGSSVLQ